MKRIAARRGFTLVEMLVVISIIAVLVYTILPTAVSATGRAKAAADAANLRSVLAEADILLLSDCTNEQLLEELGRNVPKSKSFPGATMQIVNSFPAFISIYYVDGTNYYSLDYFAKVAAGADPATLSSAIPTGDGYETDKWLTLGGAG